LPGDHNACSTCLMIIRQFHLPGDHNSISIGLVIIRQFHLPGDHNSISIGLVIIRQFHLPGDHNSSSIGLGIIRQFYLPKRFTGPVNNWSCGAYRTELLLICRQLLGQPHSNACRRNPLQLIFTKHCYRGSLD